MPKQPSDSTTWAAAYNMEPHWKRDITEASMLDVLIPVAQYAGWVAHHQRPGRNKDGRTFDQIQGTPGFPDLALAHPNRGLWVVELKAGRSWNFRPGQTHWLRASRPNSWLWQSADIDAAIKWLQGGEHQVWWIIPDQYKARCD